MGTYIDMTNFNHLREMNMDVKNMQILYYSPPTMNQIHASLNSGIIDTETETSKHTFATSIKAALESIFVKSDSSVGYEHSKQKVIQLNHLECLYLMKLNLV